MTYRVEILCAHRHDELDTEIRPGRVMTRCHTGTPLAPVGIRCNVEVAAAEARKLARDAGWIFIGGAWRCPACKPKADPVT